MLKMATARSDRRRWRGWLTVVEVLARDLGDLIPKCVRSVLSSKRLLLYDANDRALLMPVFVAGDFQQRLVNSQANYFQHTEFGRMTVTPFHFVGNVFRSRATLFGLQIQNFELRTYGLSMISNGHVINEIRL